MWEGLGVNYKSSQVNWAADAVYFKKLGIKTIRPSLSSFPNSPYTAGSEGNVIGSIEWWRQCAIFFQSQGFEVVYGIARTFGISGTFDAAAWAIYRANVIADAIYNKSIGFEPEYYQIGNEIEGIINNTTYTQTQLIADLKTLATDLKPYISPKTKLLYSTYDLGSTMFNNWISAGLGDLDVLAGNVYSQVGANGRNFIFGDMGRLGIMLKNFGRDRFILTEFGIDGNATQYNQAPEYNRNYVMRHIYAGLRELDFKLAVVYNYVGYLNGDNDFALKNTNGTFDIQWGVLTSDGGNSSITNTGGDVSDIRGLSPSRTNVTVARTLRSQSTRPVFLDARGNFAPMNCTPSDQNALRIGSSSDFSVVFRGVLFPKTAQGNTSSHTIARSEFLFASNLGYLFQVTNSTGRLRVLVGSTTFDSNAGVVPYDTEVTIVFTITGSTLRGYVNGNLVTWFTSGATTQPITRNNGDPNNLNWFFAETGGVGTGTGGVMGKVYEVMSVKSALSQTQINQLIAGNYPAFDIRYSFTRGAGRWVADLSGNNNHGLIGVELWGRQ